VDILAINVSFSEAYETSVLGCLDCIRMLKDVEVENLKFNFNDGKNHGLSPPYEI
jgi:hypothetical protein